MPTPAQARLLAALEGGQVMRPGHGRTEAACLDRFWIYPDCDCDGESGAHDWRVETTASGRVALERYIAAHRPPAAADAPTAHARDGAS